MAFSVKSKKNGTTYYLHTMDVELKGAKGKKQAIYWFAKELGGKGSPVAELPAGKMVVENPRTGLPILKKK